jgi:dimethylamine/trimethylamine dehydrogenase
MNPRYSVLFEPVTIGPVTAPNRFYQVPHTSGMTETNPRVRAAFRGTKAEGGWGVVSTRTFPPIPHRMIHPCPLPDFGMRTMCAHMQ